MDKYNVAMAGVLAQPDHSGRVPIRLQNFLSHPITRAKNYDLAEFDCNIARVLHNYLPTYHKLVHQSKLHFIILPRTITNNFYSEHQSKAR